MNEDLKYTEPQHFGFKYTEPQPFDFQIPSRTRALPTKTKIPEPPTPPEIQEEATIFTQYRPDGRFAQGGVRRNKSRKANRRNKRRSNRY